MMSRSVCWFAALTLSAFAQADWVTWPGCPTTSPSGEPLRVLQPETQDRYANMLYLHSCNITKIDSILENIPNIRSVNLENNKIEMFAANAFNSANKLKHLFLDNNNFLGRNLHPELLRQCRFLEHISFSGNDMTDTPSEFLQGLNLQTLELNSCSLREVPLFILRQDLPRMRRLSISKNLIRKLENPYTLSFVKNLYFLDLSNNLIELIHADLFKETTLLQKLYLSNNKLNYIPEKLFQNKPSLDKLDLSNNVIEYVPVNAFEGTAPFELNLSDNRLTQLPDQFCTELGHAGARMDSFYFDNNPWQCACLNDILVEVKRLGITYTSKRYNGRERVCVMMGWECNRSSDEHRQIYDNF